MRVSPIYSIRGDDGRELWWTTGRRAAHRWAWEYANGYAKGHGFTEARCHVYLRQRNGMRLKATYEPPGQARVISASPKEMELLPPGIPTEWP